MSKLPSLAKAKARTFAGGGIVGATPGRADQVPMDVPSGSHVIPADVTSGLGQGNTMAGIKTLDQMFKAGPYGTKPPKMEKGRGATRPVGMSRLPRAPKMKFADGGDVPVAVSHGEYVIAPEQVAAIGGGNVNLGHEILDEFIRQQRSANIAALQSLPGPAK